MLVRCAALHQVICCQILGNHSAVRRLQELSGPTVTSEKLQPHQTMACATRLGAAAVVRLFARVWLRPHRAPSNIPDRDIGYYTKHSYINKHLLGAVTSHAEVRTQRHRHARRRYRTTVIMMQANHVSRFARATALHATTSISPPGGCASNVSLNILAR